VRVVRSYDFGKLKRSLAVPSHVGGSRPKRAFSAMMKRLLVPDRDITWYPFGLSAACRLARSGKVGALYSTSPNITNHLVAARLARRFKLPWVADFRDLWTIDPSYNRRGWRQRLEKQIERAILRRASRILIVSEGFRDRLVEAYPEAGHKIHVVRNGFDHADVAGLAPSPPRDRLVLTYAGMFYGGRRDPGPFLRALAHLKQSGVLTAEDFRFDVIGLPEPQVVEQVQRLGISELVEFSGYLPYREALARMARSSALVVLMFREGNCRGQMDTKFYDYLGVRRPILALSPKGYEMAAIVERLNAGTVIPPDDSAGIAAWVAAQLRRLGSDGPLRDLDARQVMQFTRAEGTRQLAGVLDDVAQAA
jgi:glycosyltransferase involved in cell wall biosynthesis